MYIRVKTVNVGNSYSPLLRIHPALRLANDQLHRIRCTSCGHSKPPSEFSGRRIYLLRQQIVDQVPSDARQIRCFHCTARQRQHISCAVCGDTKELKYFSGVQRKMADRAVCTHPTSLKENIVSDVACRLLAVQRVC